jgi:PleD family two-component response regulator
VIIDGADILVSMSAGVATYRPGLPLTADQLLIRADGAMYESKGTGKDRVSVDSES